MISACIVNWNTTDHLRKCIESVLAADTNDPVEIVVVDNASEDGSAEMVREEFPSVHLIANEHNAGYAEGNNQAIRASAGDITLLLNPDVMLPPEGIQLMVNFVADHPDAAGVAPRLILPDGSVQRSIRRFPGPWEVFCEVTLLSRLFRRSRLFARYWMPDFHYDEARVVDQPMASCLMFRREDLDSVGLFDTDFPIFFNDVDLCYKLAQAGRRVYFMPGVDVDHFHGASTKQVRKRMFRESNRSLITFYEKHYRGNVSPLIYWPIVWLIKTGGYIKYLLAPAPQR